jgi:CubicO group peptidase (beta-lactamase class C family)
MKYFRFAVISAVLLISLHQQTVNGDTAPPADLDNYIARAMKVFDVPGLSIAIVKDGKVVLTKGYGVRKMGEAMLVDENTLFGIGSNTKAFTSAALAILVDEGKISWDDRVFERLPTFRMYDPYVSNEMTIRDMLTIGVVWVWAREICLFGRTLPIPAMKLFFDCAL